MGIDAEKLDAEADADFAKMIGQPQPAPASAQDKPEAVEPAATEVPPPEPVAASEPPAPNANDDWQDKYTKAEESRKNAHALMTQATQKAADLERSNQEMQQQLSAMQQQLNQLSQAQPAIPSPQEPDTGDQFKELREDYEELNPVFKTLDETAKRNQALEQRLAAIEQERNQQQQQSVQEQFWSEVKKTHPDVQQISASPDFQGWFARQNPGLQQMSQVSPEGAAHVMTLYKQSQGTHSPQTKMQQAQQMAEPQVRTRSQPSTQGQQPALTPDQIAALPQDEYSKNEAEYDKMLQQWFKQGGRL